MIYWSIINSLRDVGEIWGTRDQRTWGKESYGMRRSHWEQIATIRSMAAVYSSVWLKAMQKWASLNWGVQNNLFFISLQDLAASILIRRRSSALWRSAIYVIWLAVTRLVSRMTVFLSQIGWKYLFDCQQDCPRISLLCCLLKCIPIEFSSVFA